MLRPDSPPAHALRPEAFRAIGAAAEAARPAEACGLAWADRIEVLPNACVGPDTFRLCAAGALRLERALRDADPPLALWHSHSQPWHAEGLSDVDRRCAAPAGEPLHPSLLLVVVDVRHGAFAGARAYAWTDGAFAEIAAFRP